MRMGFEESLASLPVERGALFEHGPRLFGTIQLRERDAQAVQDDALLGPILLTSRQEQCGLIVQERRGVILARPFDDSESVPACEGATLVTECRCQFQGGFEGCYAPVGRAIDLAYRPRDTFHCV